MAQLIPGKGVVADAIQAPPENPEFDPRAAIIAALDAVDDYPLLWSIYEVLMSGVIKRGKIVRADLANYDGRNTTYSRPDATGGTISGVPVGNDVDVLSVYGGGTARNDATIRAALQYIGAGVARLSFAPGTWTIDDNVTIPSTLPCHVAAGCVFNVASGKTLTFNGAVQVDYLPSWYTGSGTVSATLSNDCCVSVKDFGAVGDGVTDDTDALNDAFITCSNNGDACFIPAGKYKISDTLQATPHGSTHQSCHITGAGAGYWGATVGNQTLIDASALTDRPAINIYRSRGAYLGHFQIQGSGKEIETQITVGSMRYDSSWVTSGYRDSRYSPHCGIAIDAGLGTTPPDGGYSSMTYGSGGGGTAFFVLDNIVIRRFVVGFMHNPEADASQGDQWLLINPQIYNTKVAIAVGQAQARCGTVLGGGISRCRTAYDGLEYGQRQGAAPIFVGTQFWAVFELFSHDSGFGTCKAVGIRTEEVHRIGYIPGATLAYPTLFDDCEIHLLNPSLNPQSRCPVVLESTNANFIMNGGSLGEAEESFSIIANNAILTGTQIRVANRFQPYVGGRQDLGSPVELRGCRVVDSTAGLLYGSNARKVALSVRESECWSPTRRVTGASIYEYVPNSGTSQDYVSAGTNSSIAFTATTLTFDNTDPNAFCVGDLIGWQFLAIGKSANVFKLPGAKVTAINSNTISCDLLYPRSYYDETYSPSSAQIYLRMWAPGVALTGDTNSNTTLSNVSPTTILQNGDWITADSGIPAKTRVRSGGGTATITLSRAATDTATGKVLYWDVLATPVLDPAF